MAKLTGKTEEKITEELVRVIFKNPLTDQWESGDEYLSGNVRDKLNTARTDRKSTRLNSSHSGESRMPSSA